MPYQDEHWIAYQRAKRRSNRVPQQDVVTECQSQLLRLLKGPPVAHLTLAISAVVHSRWEFPLHLGYGVVMPSFFLAIGYKNRGDAEL